jgi:L-alanine-DL-glutamate epimerase-like enolase superfamily enzyme
VEASLPKAKITRVRIYQPPNLNQLLNQSNMVVTVETDIGITGVGEGGSKDTLEQAAGSLIGKDPFRIDAGAGAPNLVEDPTRDEQFLEDIPRLRQMTTVPLAAGEEWGQRWNFNRLVENHDIDYNRCTLPNVGGIIEFLKIMAMCEMHVVGIVPHFTGPISTAALVNCLATFPGPVLFEFNYGDRAIDYLPECLDFKQGKVYPNERPGLGATLEMKLLKPIGEVTQPIRRQIYQRPDGSLTHW